MIFAYILNSLHPSIIAASSISLGKARINCVIRKTKKPSVAKNFGTISGKYVLTQPNWLYIIYCGISFTWIGSINVPNININQIFFSGNWSLLKAYAANEHDNKLPITAKKTIKKEFTKNLPYVTPDIPCHPPI